MSSKAAVEPPLLVSRQPAGIQAVLREAFARHTVNLPFRNMIAVGVDDQLFPSSFQLEHAGLVSYSRLPEESRKNDLYLFSPIDNYWPSEYFVNDIRIPFTCGFIIQVLPSPEGARIEVYESFPIVVAGKHWAVGHSGPGRYLDIRLVEPTIDDRNALLVEIRRILGPSPAHPLPGRP